MTPDEAYGNLLDVLGALSLLVILAMLLERSLALIFDYHWFNKLSDRYEGLKAPIALAFSWYTCSLVNFDVLGRLFSAPGEEAQPTAIGIFITSVIVAGGSAGVITLFQGVLNFGRDSRLNLIEANKAKAAAHLAEAWASIEKAEAETEEAKARKEMAVAHIVEVKSHILHNDPDELDTCCLDFIGHATPDEDIPPAQGGVLPL